MIIFRALVIFHGQKPSAVEEARNQMVDAFEGGSPNWMDLQQKKKLAVDVHSVHHCSEEASVFFFKKNIVLLQ